MILFLKTDTPVCELSIQNNAGRHDFTWEAGRKLSSGLMEFIENSLKSQQVHWHDLTGIVVFRGPGSFTGLRIGATVANTIAYSQNIPIVGVTGDQWQQEAMTRLKAGENDRIVLPEYGRPARITQPRK